MRFYVNKWKFKVLYLPSLGMKDVLVVPVMTDVFIKSCVHVAIIKKYGSTFYIGFGMIV